MRNVVAPYLVDGGQGHDHARLAALYMAVRRARLERLCELVDEELGLLRGPLRVSVAVIYHTERIQRGHKHVKWTAAGTCSAKAVTAGLRNVPNATSES